MKDCSRWSRREFVQMAGSLAAMNFGSPLLAAISAADGTAAAKFAYVGFGGKGAEEEGIEVDEYEGLPLGTVEAYAINGVNGTLKLVNRQRLSLSATAPRHAAISPDGRALVVAVHGGGAYNVLPLGKDGSVGAVSGILKETGSGPHDKQRSAHPQMVVFDHAGRVVTADLGSDRLSVLKLDNARLCIAGRCAAQA